MATNKRTNEQMNEWTTTINDDDNNSGCRPTSINIWLNVQNKNLRFVFFSFRFVCLFSSICIYVGASEHRRNDFVFILRVCERHFYLIKLKYIYFFAAAVKCKATIDKWYNNLGNVENLSSSSSRPTEDVMNENLSFFITFFHVVFCWVEIFGVVRLPKEKRNIFKLNFSK